MRMATPGSLHSCTSGENRSRMRSSSAAYCSSVYSTNFELLRVGVVAGIDAHLLHPFRRFHRGLGLEMNVGDDRHVAAARAQASGDMLCRFAASFTVGAVMRTISQPTATRSSVCPMDAAVSIVSQVIIDCTRIGLLPPTRTLPMGTSRVGRLEYEYRLSQYCRLTWSVRVPHLAA